MQNPLTDDWRIGYRARMDGAKLLKAWIARMQMNQLQAARFIKMDPTHLSQILTRQRRPGLDNAVKIARATGVPVEAWVSFTSDNRARDASDAA